MIFKNFYSGFCLENEGELFSQYIIKNDFTLAGFSYGAIKAFEEALNTKRRVDKLQLFSPAFFQTKDKKFRRMQLMFFKKDANSYCNNFLENIINPSKVNCNKFFKLGTYNQLDELMNYEWKEEELELLVQKGTKIEVFLGSEDKIIEAQKAKDFFTKYASVYYIKNVGHTLNN